jgi:hypothetical protein
MKTVTLELTKTEVKCLYNLVCENMERGDYWGNHEQFMKMQDNIFNKLKVLRASSIKMDCETEEAS